MLHMDSTRKHSCCVLKLSKLSSALRTVPRSGIFTVVAISCESRESVSVFVHELLVQTRCPLVFNHEDAHRPADRDEPLPNFQW